MDACALARQVPVRIMRERHRGARTLRDRDILVEIIRRAIARRLVDAGNMSPRRVRRRLRHQLVRLRIAERPGVRRARERMRMPRQIPRLRPRITLRRAVAIDKARAARERVVHTNGMVPTVQTCAHQERRVTSSG